MRVWLIRHGATDVPPSITVGSGDPPLSEAGREQARRLAARLRSRPLGEVWSSDLRRAAETAAIIAAPHGLAVRTAPELRELDFGAWEGRDLRELWREDPDAARAWEGDITATPTTFGESVHQLQARVQEFWERRDAVTGEVAVVAHRGSLAALQSWITGRLFAESFSAPWALVEAPAPGRLPGRNASRSPRRREASRPTVRPAR